MSRRNGIYNPSRAACMAALFLIVTVSFFIGYDPIIEEAEAVQPIAVVMDFQFDGRHRTGSTVDIYTGPGKTGQTSLNGTVTIYRSAKVLRTKVFFNLYFSVDKTDNSGITGTIFPQVWEFDPGWYTQTIPIKVNLLVPPMTRYSTGVSPLINVTVWGEWFANYQDSGIGPFASGDIPEYPIFVNIRPYHYLQMSFNPVMLELSPGSSGWVECIMFNTGNGFERVEIAIPNQLAYAKAGWVFEFEETSLDIGPGSQASTRIKVTAPRKVQFKVHMEMHDFPVHAESYYSQYQVKDGILLEKVEYDMGFMVYVFGVDFVFVPWAWAIVMFIALAVVLMNLGINIFTLKKRKMPRGTEPGFFALYHMVSNPERRARARARMEERRKLRKELREERKAEKEALKENRPGKVKPPGSLSVLEPFETEKKRAPVLDLKRTDDDFDIAIPDKKPGHSGERPKISFLNKARKRDKVETDMVDILSSLDD